jgi:hypothetical protein
MDFKMNRWVSACCRGENCSMCGEPATAKVEETIFDDDPFQHRHNLTAYVCDQHFRQIMGLAGTNWVDNYRSKLLDLNNDD